MLRTKEITTLSLLAALAVGISLAEQWIPMPVPGVKPGLSNVIVLITLTLFGFNKTCMLVTVKCVLAAVIYGGATYFLYSFCGGLVSLMLMALLYRFFINSLSVISISMAGAVAHIAAQLCVAAIVMRSAYVFYMLPMLLVTSVVSGVFVGICVYFFTKHAKYTRGDIDEQKLY